MFELIEKAPPDPIFGLTDKFKKDPNPEKVKNAQDRSVNGKKRKRSRRLPPIGRMRASNLPLATNGRIHPSHTTMLPF